MNPGRECKRRERNQPTCAIGLFNRSLAVGEVAAKWSDLKLQGKQTVRDLWRQKDHGRFEGQFHVTVPAHGLFWCGSASKLPVTRHYHKVLDRKDVDAIITATPEHWRALICIRAC